jgi:hypothetical protein
MATNVPVLEYWPFDQATKLPPPPWKSDLPALVEWEAAHGHDVRLKCYPEFGCRVVELALEAENARLREAVDDARRWAAHLEAQNAAGLALHQSIPFDSESVADDYLPGCMHCRHPWPCPTVKALGDDL